MKTTKQFIEDAIFQLEDILRGTPFKYGKVYFDYNKSAKVFVELHNNIQNTMEIINGIDKVKEIVSVA